MFRLVIIFVQPQLRMLLTEWYMRTLIHIKVGETVFNSINLVLFLL